MASRHRAIQPGPEVRAALAADWAGRVHRINPAKELLQKLEYCLKRATISCLLCANRVVLSTNWRQAILPSRKADWMPLVDWKLVKLNKKSWKG